VKLPHLLTATLAAALTWAVGAGAQTTRPRASLQPVTPEVTLAPGASADLVLTVSMPPDVHVQAQGVKVDSIAYPSPSELAQAGRADPLLVLGPTFDIRARLSVSSDAREGLHSIPVVLRYQACNETVCFPPARATAAWTVRVAALD
jgi:hypothetical protein